MGGFFSSRVDDSDLSIEEDVGSVDTVGTTTAFGFAGCVVETLLELRACASDLLLFVGLETGIPILAGTWFESAV